MMPASLHPVMRIVEHLCNAPHAHRSLAVAIFAHVVCVYLPPLMSANVSVQDDAVMTTEGIAALGRVLKQLDSCYDMVALVRICSVC